MSEEIGTWLAELERLQQSSGNDEGFTGPELREMLKIGEKKFFRLLRAGVQAGKILVGQREVMKDWDGRHRVYTVYRLPTKGKKK